MYRDNERIKKMDESKKELSQARFSSLGSYKALYDYERVDAVYEGAPMEVWRGRVMIEPQMDNVPGMKKKVDTGWIFFTREYDDRNDWDRLYHEIEFNEELFGIPFILVPKEKLLFAYDPPPKEGIILPSPSIQFPRTRGGKR